MPGGQIGPFLSTQIEGENNEGGDCDGSNEGNRDETVKEREIRAFGLVLFVAGAGVFGFTHT